LKSLEAFKTFYEQQLISELQPLEQERKSFIKKSIRNFLILLFFAGIGYGMFYLFFVQIEHFSVRYLDGSTFMFLYIYWILLGVAGIVIFTLSYYKFYKKFVKNFKTNIIQKIVKFIDNGLLYNQTAGISSGTFMQSNIFLKSPDRYKTEDRVAGIIEKTSIEFAEIHSEYKTVTTDSKGNTKTQWHTIFKGLFFIADFNKDFKTQTVVLPDTLEKMFGFIGKTLQSWNMGRDKLINLEDPEFEKYFAV